MSLCKPFYGVYHIIHCSIFIWVICSATTFANNEVPYDENRFAATVLETGMPRPLELEVTSDGRVFFIELAGKFKIYDPKTEAVEVAATFDIFEGQENGLLGITLDPDFDNNQWIYILYSPSKEYVGQYVSRFTMTGNRLDKSSEKIILKIPEHRDDCCHHAGSMAFGPDGNLFITTGDNTHPGGNSQGYAPIDEREGRHVFDAQDTSGNTMDLRGKILRITPQSDGSYTIPPGNLFTPGGEIMGLPEIYVMGCRNPWRMNVDQKTGYVYWGEVGPDAGGDGPKGPRGYDEINQARKAGNFGWPFFIGNNFAYYDFDYQTGEIGLQYDVKKPLNTSPTNTGSQLLPVPSPAWIYYPYGKSEVFPEMGSGGRTACAGPVYHFDENLKSDTKLPRHLDNCLFIYDWQRKIIKYVRLDENSDIIEIQPFLTEIDINRAVDMRIGPKGSLYVLDYGDTWGNNKDSKLLKIDYFKGNRPPVAQIASSTMVGKAPLELKLSAESSSDKDIADKHIYEWFIEDEIFASSGSPVTTYTLNKPGEYKVGVRLDDGKIKSNISYVSVIVGNDPPSVEINKPTHGGFFDWDETLDFIAEINDFEDGSSSKNAELISRRIIWNPMIFESAPENVEKAAQSGQGTFTAGLTMIQHSDCLNCHAIDKKIIGPSFKEIAQRYKNDNQALEKSAQRIIKGSSKVWGEVPMLPHAQFSTDEAKEMVKWIFSLAGSKNYTSTMQSVSGKMAVKKPQNWSASGGGSLVIKSTYTDLGGGGAPPITRHDEVRLRHRRVEAEHHSSKHGTTILANDETSGGKFIGSISSGHYLVFKDVLLEKFSKLEFRVASPSAGGRVELRLGGRQGPILAVLNFKATGGWDVYRSFSVPVTPPNSLSDVFCIFINPKGGGPFMNLDYIEFQK